MAYRLIVEEVETVKVDLKKEIEKLPTEETIDIDRIAKELEQKRISFHKDELCQALLSSMSAGTLSPVNARINPYPPNTFALVITGFRVNSSG